VLRSGTCAVIIKCPALAPLIATPLFGPIHKAFGEIGNICLLAKECDEAPESDETISGGTRGKEPA